MKDSTNEQVGEAEPVFRVETVRDPIFQDNSRGITQVAGTRLFVFGKEIPGLVSFKHETNYAGVDAIISTTVTLTLYGAQVETLFEKFETPKAAVAFVPLSAKA